VSPPEISPISYEIMEGEKISISCEDKEAFFIYNYNDSTLPTSFNGIRYN
jgi:hypothetical protein